MKIVPVKGGREGCNWRCETRLLPLYGNIRNNEQVPAYPRAYIHQE